MCATPSVSLFFLSLNDLWGSKQDVMERFRSVDLECGGADCIVCREFEDRTKVSDSILVGQRLRKSKPNLDFLSCFTDVHLSASIFITTKQSGHPDEPSQWQSPNAPSMASVIPRSRGMLMITIALHIHRVCGRAFCLIIETNARHKTTLWT